MATIIPHINPIRIIKGSTRINYNTYMPQFDRMESRVQYQKGVFAQKNYYPDHLKGKELSLLVYTTASAASIDAIFYKPDLTTFRMTVTDITPTGWVSENVIKLTATPSDIGINRIAINLEGYWYLSDEFRVKTNSASETEKDLVEFEYYDSQNRYGGFFDGDNGTWRPKAYYTGIIKVADGETEQTVFVDEPGNPLLLETTESDGIEVILTDLTTKDYTRIKWQRKCDNFYINGRKMTCLDISMEEKDPNSDMCDVTLRCAYAENTGFYNY